MLKAKMLLGFLLIPLLVFLGCTVSDETIQEQELLEDEKLVGCQYGNPECKDTEECLDNECVLRMGCTYNNPPCSSVQNCENNECVLKTGCDYDNPICDNQSDCINNECIKKAGCSYSNPDCNSSQICQNNKCYRLIRNYGGGY